MVGSSDVSLGSSDISVASLPINRKLLTLAVVNDGSRVLLGLKKRGFGEGYYNGFGGKVEEGETIDQAAVRELKEEAGISPIGMTKLGILIFHFDDKPCPWEVHVFNVPEFTGEPCESDEMLPTWFAHEQIPFGYFGHVMETNFSMVFHVQRLLTVETSHCAVVFLSLTILDGKPRALALAQAVV
ncbi:7-8-dihydro-8-oxoguanine triphosphatase [Nymphaea thermarum]|nr:7-8-dihydro-8-oxoguanine triphosphatase [Nymphaea thermarum]